MISRGNLSSSKRKACFLMVFAGLLLSTVFFIPERQRKPVAKKTVGQVKSPRTFLKPKKMDQKREFLIKESSKYKTHERFVGQKLVHLDLKGAPPLVSYFEKLFPLLKRLGATGVLMEYEDMFPYYDTLKNIPAYNAYNKSEIRTIQRYATKSGLKVIPLVQTFGHLEFVLKLEDYRDLREVDAYPQVVCPTHSRTLPTIFKMIDQVVLLHPGLTHIHIGSDEVYHIGRCERCQRVMSEQRWTKEILFLSHVRNVTEYIKKRHPNVRPIMWDDEFRSLPDDMIEEFGVARMVDIMIWKYTPNVDEFITDEILEKYSKLFVGIWIATAFKGASTPSSMVTDVRYHLENHKSWMELLGRWKNKLHVQGVALTGWQRYDHFAILCELLPVAIPSLTVCLRYLDGHAVDENTMSKMLECEFPFAWSPSGLSSLRSSTSCSYPGSSLYHLVSSLYVTIQDIKGTNRDVARGWFTWHQTIHNFSSPIHVEESTSMVDYHKIQLQSLEDRLRTELGAIYDSYTVDEWIASFILPTAARLAAAAEARDRLTSQRTWPRRPIETSLSDQRLLKGICDGSGSLQCALLGL